MTDDDVIIVSTNALPSVGGVELYTAALVRELARAGLRTTLVTTTREAPEPALVLRSIGLLGGRVPVPVSLAQIARTVRACYGAGRRTVTIVQTRIYPVGLIFAAAAGSRGQPLVVLDHSTGHVPVGSSIAQRLCDAYEHVATLIFRMCGARFWAVSPASAQWLGHFGIRAVRVLPNAVDQSLLEFERERAAGDELVAFYAGRLIEEKGVLDAIESIARLRARGVRWRLEIAGSGPLERTVAARAAETDGVKFLGSLPHSDLIAALRRADALLLPSRYPEGLPTVALEAAALGVPIVATSRGGLGELLAGGARGFVLPEGTADAIAAGLEELRSSAARAEVKSVAMREFVSRHHTWSAVIEPAARDLRGMLHERVHAT